MTVLASICKQLGNFFQIFVPVSAPRENSQLLEEFLGCRFHDLGAGLGQSITLDTCGQYVLVQQYHCNRSNSHVKLPSLGRRIGVYAMPVLVLSRCIGDRALGTCATRSQATIHTRIIARYRIIQGCDARYAHRQKFVLVVRIVQRCC